MVPMGKQSSYELSSKLNGEDRRFLDYYTDKDLKMDDERLKYLNRKISNYLNYQEIIRYMQAFVIKSISKNIKLQNNYNLYIYHNIFKKHASSSLHYAIIFG